MPDYVPKNDSQYRDWLGNFITILTAHLGDVGLMAPDITPLDGAKLLFDAALGDHQAKKAVAQAATAVKNTERDNTEDLLRPLVRRIQGHPGMTNDLRAALGLPARDDVRTTSTPGEEVPDLFLESLPGKIIVHFGMAPANERLNSKPSWAKGCNIYRKKAGESAFVLIASESASPYVDMILGPAADYTYVVQYRGTRASDTGTESSPMTIAASGLLAA